MIETFLRKLFKRCLHVWEFKKMNATDEIVSSKDYSMQRCNKCNKTKYRKL